MSDFCKECYKKHINPNINDDHLVLSDHSFLCSECACLRPIVIGEGFMDKIGGYHMCDCGFNPLGHFCKECNKTTCEDCTEACVYEEFIPCEQCVLKSQCEKQLNGCFSGEKECYKYYHIRPQDNGCVVMAYNSETKELYEQNKGKDTDNTLIFPTEESAVMFIKYGSVIADDKKEFFMPEPFLLTDKMINFSKIF